LSFSVRRLTKRFGAVVALRHISFSSRPGVTLILGPNGSGKSTLLRILAGLYRPSAGTVSYRGRNLAQWGTEYRDLIGYLPQDFGVFPSMTAREFLIYLGRLKKIPEHLVQPRINVVAAGMDIPPKWLKTRRGRYPAGMKRKIGLAQALLNDPEVLLLDEPLRGMDPQARRHTILLLAALCKQKTAFIVSHTAAGLEDIAHDVMILHQGVLLGKWSVRSALEEVSGRVWEVRQALDSPDRAGWVIARRQQANGVAWRLLLDQGPPPPGAEPVTPTLKDAYLYLLRLAVGDDGFRPPREGGWEAWSAPRLQRDRSLGRRRGSGP